MGKRLKVDFSSLRPSLSIILDPKLWTRRHSCLSFALILLKECTTSPAKVLCIEIWLQGMCYLLLE